MRVLVLYDLPMSDGEDRGAYSRFHRYLIKNGFLMLQESVYCKLALNQTAVNVIMDKLRKNKPPEGLIQVLCITEKQFARSEFILGERTTEVIDSDERLIVL